MGIVDLNSRVKTIKAKNFHLFPVKTHIQVQSARYDLYQTELTH